MLSELEDRFCPECGVDLHVRQTVKVLKIALLIFLAFSGLMVFASLLIHSQLTAAYAERDRLLDENSGLKDHVSFLAYRVSDLQSRLDDYRVEVDRLQGEVEELQRLMLRRPTYAELGAFLRVDDTDENEWVEGQYVCINFAGDLKAHARAAGFNVSYVQVNFYVASEGYGHAFNGVILADGRHVYV